MIASDGSPFKPVEVQSFVLHPFQSVLIAFIGLSHGYNTFSDMKNLMHAEYDGE